MVEQASLSIHAFAILKLSREAALGPLPEDAFGVLETLNLSDPRARVLRPWSARCPPRAWLIFPVAKVFVEVAVLMVLALAIVLITLCTLR